MKAITTIINDDEEIERIEIGNINEEPVEESSMEAEEIKFEDRTEEELERLVKDKVLQDPATQYFVETLTKDELVTVAKRMEGF